MTARAALAALMLLVCIPAQAQDTALPVAANAFYSAYAVLPRMGGLPNATARARLLPLLSPRLAKLITDAVAAETRFQAKNKSAPPLIEGDLFSSLFEGFGSFKLGACSGDAKAGRCTVQLHHQDAGQKPVDWSDEVLLVNTQTGWKVDDIAYKAGFAFGNTGLLSETLKFVLATAP